MRISRALATATAALVLASCGGADTSSTQVAPTSADPDSATGTASAGPAPDTGVTSAPPEADSPASAVPTTATDSAGATGSGGSTATGDDDTAASATSTSSSPEPTTQEPEASPLGGGPVTILLIGTDSRDPASMGGASDTIMLMHLPEDREEIALVSLTRDMWVDIPGLGQGKINSAFARGGTDTLRATVSDLLGGVEIDYVLQSNFQGFINLTRWLEGFEVDNQHASSVTVGSTGRQVVFEEGEIWLENTDGLIYSRERKTLPLGDLDRTERQRAVLIGMMDRMQERLEEDPQDFPELVANLRDNVKVTGDLDVADFVALAPLLTELDPEDTISLMVPITGFDMIAGQSVNIVDREQTSALGEALREDSLEEYVERWGTGYAPGG
ncbi:LCP family protein [Serinicoccus profundi]|uniref:LCP family protein n=1 Tax=Serinicoccus profundi TaxID=1078471 RepID=UPI000255E5C5|nr:LCP family protein [Serinicoccus profundi]